MGSQKNLVSQRYLLFHNRENLIKGVGNGQLIIRDWSAFSFNYRFLCKTGFKDTALRIPFSKVDLSLRKRIEYLYFDQVFYHKLIFSPD